MQFDYYGSADENRPHQPTPKQIRTGSFVRIMFNNKFMKSKDSKFRKGRVIDIDKEIALVEIGLNKSIKCNLDLLKLARK